MVKPLRRLAFGSAACLLAAGALAGPADDGLRRLAASSNRPGSLVRIGLEPGHRVTVKSTRPFRIVDPETGDPAWKPAYAGEIVAVADGGPEEDPGSIYRVQVAAFATKEAAEAERARLEASFHEPGVVRFVPDRGSWRVRLGKGTERAALAPLLQRLRDAGMQGIWIAEEPAVALSGISVRLVDGDWNAKLTGKTRLAVVPEPGAFVSVQGKPYRGVVELRIDGQGRIRPIDWVETESYLQGVVPSELGPETWPQLEALKAQAVAARTYLAANLAQFADDGYDLCATPRCQVYGGVAAEHPLSDRAVAATRGELLEWEGKPISALYTATCGGHTEDAAAVFPEQAAPYLKGVPCAAEGEGATAGTVEGRAVDPVAIETGEDVTREIALAAAAGVIEARWSVRELGRPAGATELRRWTRVIARLSGRPEPRGPETAPASLGAAAEAIVRDLAIDERGRVLLSAGDLPALLRDPAAAALAEAPRRALAQLVLAGAVRAGADGALGVDRAPSRARLLAALVRLAEAGDAFALREASVASLARATLRLVQGKGSLDLPLGPRPYLFGSSAGKSVSVARLDLWLQDRVRVRTGADGRIDFLELRPPLKGASDDRSAAVYSWEVRRSRREVEESVNKRVAVGTLRDLEVLRRGVSGRIAELKVVGSDGATVVRGFDIRNLLDLRESLAVIEIEREAGGGIASVVFSGKGWGHGVGLCQVGAYGMALRGKDYRAILAHYYTGAVLTAAAPPTP